MTKLLLEVGAIVQNPDCVRQGPTYISVEDGRITHIHFERPIQAEDGIEVIRRPKSIAIPGLVNTHGHAAMTLLRGAGDDMPLSMWLTERIFPLEGKLTGEAIYWGTLLASWEMIRSGTTCFTDMYMEMEYTARAVEESGMRGVLSRGVVGMDDESRQKGIQNSRSFAEAWHRQAEGRITVTLGPHAPYTCPPDYLEQIAELSEELSLPVQIHLSETAKEVEDCIRETGQSPIGLMEAVGLVKRPLLAAHCVHVSEEDIEIMRQYDVRVAHNPQSNLKLASGIAPIVKMKQAGLTVGLGTDGAASNNNLDMFEELRLAAMLHKGISGDATVIPAREAMAMATQDGARCVFLEPQHGTLTEGALADITLLDMDSPHFSVNHDLLSNVVYAAGADDVTDVFVGGRPLLSNGQPVTLDIERIRYEVRKIGNLLGSNDR